MDRYHAVIDMGSNSFRMVIYYQTDDQVINEVDNLKSTVRLGTYLDQDYNLSEEGIEKAIGTLIHFRKLCDARNVSNIIAIATAAVRKARNKDAFLKKVYERTGFRFRVLSGEEEAYYGYLAVVNTMRIRDCMTIDIGGGSTEIVKISNRELVNSYSFPFGAVTLTKQFFHHEVPTDEEITSLENYLRHMLATQPWIKKVNLPLVGMGGSARNLGKIHQKLSMYPLQSLHQYTMNNEQINTIYTFVRPLSFAQLQAVEGLSKERSDIIVAGIIIIKVLLEYTQCSHFIVSNRGLRDGVLMENQLSPIDKKPLLRDIVHDGVQNLMHRYRVNQSHAHHVAKLASQMFDQLRIENLHMYGENEKELLDVAAHLYTIGQAINLRESYRHTFYLMIHVLLPGLTHRERIIAALLASYKGTKKMYQLAAPYESLLTKDDFQMIEKLSLLLLMARALDRTATQQVTGIRYIRKKDAITLSCFGKEDQSIEMNTIEEYKKKFKNQFGYPLIIEWKNNV